MQFKNHLVLSAWLVTTTVLVIVGCGDIIGPMRGASITPSGRMNVGSPMKVAPGAVQKIATIVVPYLRDRTDFKQEDDWRLYRSGVDLVVEELRKGRGIQVVALSVQRQKDLGVFADASQMIEDEKEEHLRRLGRVGRGDAVLVYTFGANKVNMGEAFASYLFIGTINVTGVMNIRLVSSNNAQTIYEQNQDVTMTSGGRGFGNTPDNELKEMLRPAVWPLVRDLTAALGR